MTHSESELLLWERGEWEHLPYPILEAYVDELISDVDREIVEGHFAICEHCVAEARVLRAERALLARERHTTARPSPKKRPWWLPVFSGVAGAGVTAGALWLSVVQPLHQKNHTVQRALTTAQAQTEKQRALLTQRVAELESGTTNATRLTVQQAAELTVLRLKVARLEKTNVPGPVPPSAPIQVARAETELALSDLSALLSDAQDRGMNEPRTASFALLSPQRTRVRNSRPTLTWQPCPGASRYEVLIADRHDKVIFQAQGAHTRWVPDKALPQGELLFWEVHAFDAAGKELGAALGGRFAVLSGGQEATLTRRLASAKTERERAKALAEIGLFEEAELRLEALVSDSRAARWLRQIRALRKRP